MAVRHISLSSIQHHRLYESCVHDLMQHEDVRSMDGHIHHNRVTCLEHCLSVSFMSYLACYRLGLDYRAAARGGLLHDLYLYDWHHTKPMEGLHGFTHPGIALRNANLRFLLNEREQDIIIKHMWPMTLRLPRHRESYIVCLVDKYCAFLEVFHDRRKRNLERFKKFCQAASIVKPCIPPISI